MTKIESDAMLVLLNVTMEPSNVKKSKGTTKCEKRIVTCDIGTTQCEDETVKCEKKTITRTVTCDKNRTNAMLVLLNITVELSNLREKKK